jgi:hypothetical protein
MQIVSLVVRCGGAFPFNRLCEPALSIRRELFGCGQYSAASGRRADIEEQSESGAGCVALHEAEHAKDFARRKYKGTYAFAYMVPFFNLYPEAEATSDALGYLRTYEQPTDQKEGYNTLYPAYGSYIGSDVADWLAFPWNYAAMAAGVIPGHIVGRIRSATLPEAETPALPPEESPR